MRVTPPNPLLLFLFAGGCSCAGNLTSVSDVCSAVMTIDWKSRAPYIYQEKTTNTTNAPIKGILKLIVERLVRKCCGESVEFTYLPPANDSQMLREQIGSGDTVVSVPVYGFSSSNTESMHPYFPLINSPGIIYVDRIALGIQENILLSSLSKSWPIVVLIIIFTTLAGFVIWTLDSYSNEKDFPHFFLPGVWDGFWWAFVSMTTVGYGDKAPKTFQARVFAFFWCLIGMVIISIFTATLSTTLTSSSLGKDTKLYGKTLVAIKNSKEHTFGESQNAVIVPVDSLDEFVAKFTEDDTSATTTSIDGGLIDAFVAGYEAAKFTKANRMKFGHVEEYDYTYGFVVSNSLSNNSKIVKCLRRELSAEERYIFHLIQGTMAGLPKPDDTTSFVDVIDGTSVEFRMLCVVCVSLFFLLYFCGVVWHCLFYRPKSSKEQTPYKSMTRRFDRTALYGDLVLAQFVDIEQLMVGEVMAFYTKFKSKIEYIRREYAENYTKPTLFLPEETDFQKTWLFDDICHDYDPFANKRKPFPEREIFLDNISLGGLKNQKETYSSVKPPTKQTNQESLLKKLENMQITDSEKESKDEAARLYKMKNHGNMTDTPQKELYLDMRGIYKSWCVESAQILNDLEKSREEASSVNKSTPGLDEKCEEVEEGEKDEKTEPFQYVKTEETDSQFNSITYLIRDAKMI